jgi:hypothetical protein
LSSSDVAGHFGIVQNIRALNDAFPTAMTGGRVFMTAGVDALSSDVKAMVIRAQLHGVHPRQ